MSNKNRSSSFTATNTGNRPAQDWAKTKAKSARDGYVFAKDCNDDPDVVVSAVLVDSGKPSSGKYTLDTPSGTRPGDGRGLTKDHVDLLKQQGFSSGLAYALAKNALAYDHRIWVVDNSGSMQIADGHRILIRNDEYRVVESTRWEEIQDAVKYHCKMAALLDSPTLFKLLNNPGRAVGPQQFSVAERGDAYAEEDINKAMKIITKAKPGGVTPLTRHIHDIKRAIETMTPQLREDGKKVAIVLATDGLPTDEQGYGGQAANEDFVRSLRTLEGLPIWIVIRLCTDQDSVTEFYNGLDAQLELSLEVLDDFVGEAGEVYRCNSWINYALPIHRSRELGYHDRLFDLIDERPLTAGEMKDYCVLLFGKNHFTDPTIDFERFYEELVDVLREESFQWNPVKRRMMPWINLKKLKRYYGSGKECVVM